MDSTTTKSETKKRSCYERLKSIRLLARRTEKLRGEQGEHKVRQAEKDATQCRKYKQPLTVFYRIFANFKIRILTKNFCNKLDCLD